MQRVTGAYTGLENIGEAGCSPKMLMLYGENRRLMGAKLCKEGQCSCP